MQTFRTAAAAALLALATAVPQAQAADTPALGFSSTNGSFLDGGSRMIGWQFTVPQAVPVTALGWFDLGQDGLARSHQIGIWNSATQALVATTTVAAGTSAPLEGFFRYATLDAPVLLQSGVSYRIAGLDVGSGGDAHVWAPVLSGYSAHVNGFVVDGHITLGATGTAIGTTSGEFQYPNAQINDSRTALMGPNLMLAPVPEPESWALLVAGLALVGVTIRGRRIR